MATSLEEAIQDVDVLLLLVGHSQFKALNPEVVAQKTNARLVLDAVNAWPSQPWQDAGFTLKKLGNGKPL
jgi:UDP-N-acetyl-D-mannosaminuronic acid dehydrogenase